MSNLPAPASDSQPLILLDLSGKKYPTTGNINIPHNGVLTVNLALPGETNAYGFHVGNASSPTWVPVPWSGSIIKTMYVKAGDIFNFSNTTGEPNLVATTFVVSLKQPSPGSSPGSSPYSHPKYAPAPSPGSQPIYQPVSQPSPAPSPGVSPVSSPSVSPVSSPSVSPVSFLGISPGVSPSVSSKRSTNYIIFGIVGIIVVLILLFLMRNKIKR